MSLPHFYLDEQVIADEQEEVFSLRLSEDDLKHARVLRLHAGEHIALVDAQQDYFECEIIAFDEDLPSVRIACAIDEVSTTPSLMLFQGLAKGDKMDAILRQATEVGITSFTPLVTKRCVVKLDGKKQLSKMKRWNSIAKSAAMQSGRRVRPEVCEPLTLAEASHSLSRATALLVCWEETSVSNRVLDALKSVLGDRLSFSSDDTIALVVGPEGGLSSSEVDELLACNENASLVSLGPSILRTETAGVVASALVLYELRALSDFSCRG